MTDGFEYFVGQLSTIDDAGLSKPSALPGWTRKHVVSHVGFNARAAGRLVHWARTGEVTPMYPDPSTRAREIEEGAHWSGQQLRELVQREQAALASALRDLDDSDWSFEVVTAQGRTVQAGEIPWLRTRELWIHAVDLDAGGDFPDLPPDMIDRLVAQAVQKRRAGDSPGLDVRLTDRNPGGTPVGSGDGPTPVVEGAAADIARWLTRREPRGLRTSDGTPLPELGPWL
ncbi:maleylpyruvate isomerase family mycothiol-dependent enzyme [Streptomyces mirabilis]|uniref:maleylpyruvate isomerase family mycothiol-dependent enzyme n=1 Tax=Streptomyces mirabilis TaxID=68239 RepID=UPI0036590D1F